MKAPTQAQVKRRVAHWKKRLGLSGWRIAVSFGSDEEECEASCSAAPEYRAAMLRFDLTKIAPDELDNYVVHELLHLVGWPLANAAQTMAAGDPAKLEWVRTLEEHLITELEHLVIRLTSEEV